MKTLTLEEAFQNIELVLENFIGKKSDHMILEESLNTIKKSICNCKRTCQEEQ